VRHRDTEPPRLKSNDLQRAENVIMTLISHSSAAGAKNGYSIL
jgi:hypothetical protein